MAKPGDPILDVYTAAWYNKVDKYVNKKMVGPPPVKRPTQYSWVWASNHEAVAKDKFTVVNIVNQPKLLVSDRLDNINEETIWITSDPAGGTDLFVLLDPLPGEIGAQARVLVSGVTLVKTKKFTDTIPRLDKYLHCVGPDATDLEESPTGRLQVLLNNYLIDIVDDHGGEFDYLLVIAGHYSNGGDVGRFILVEDPEGGSSGPTGDPMTAFCYIVREDDPTITINDGTTLYLNYDMFSDLEDGDYGTAVKDVRGHWIAVNAPCSTEAVSS